MEMKDIVIWCMFAPVIIVSISAILYVVITAIVRRRRNETCFTCRYREYIDCVYGGTGWEPLPFWKTCSQWRQNNRGEDES